MSCLSGAPPAGALADPTRVLRNFVVMSVCFSLNHGAVTALLALAVPLLGKEAGSISTGTLYVAYALTALLLAAPIMGCLGTRRGLIVGCWVYCGYIASFPLALTVDTKAEPHNPFLIAVAVGGGIVGGFAAGFLWNAQGAYFSSSTKMYAKSKGVSQEAATGSFAAIFASIFLSFEVVLKLLASAIKLLNVKPPHAPPGPNGTAPNSTAPNGSLLLQASNGTARTMSDGSDMTGNTVVAVVYSIIGVAASVFMLLIWDLDRKIPPGEQPLSAVEDGSDKDATQPSAPSGCAGCGAKVMAAGRLWCKHPNVLLLNLIQVAFGVSATLLYIQVSGKVVKATFGSDDSVTVVGFMAATTALVAALCQVPFARLSSGRIGKPPFMVLSLSAFVALGALVAALPLETLGMWPVLVTLYVLQGIGRAGYEGANKAIYADFFPDDAVAAFGNVILFNGAASSASSYLFGACDDTILKGKKVCVPWISTTGQSLISVACGVLAIVGYIIAEVMQRRRQRGAATGYSAP